MSRTLFSNLVMLLRNIFAENISLKLIAMFITLTIVILVAGESIQISKKIKIEYITSPQMMISNDVPFEFDIIISGPKNLITAIRGKNLNYKIDLTEVEPGPAQVRIVPEKLNLSRRIVVSGIFPTSVYPKLERVSTKSVPVKLRYANLNSKIKSWSLEPESIQISGPQSKVDKTDALYTEMVDFGQITKNTTYELSLLKDPQISLVNLSSEKIKVHIELFKR